MEELSIKSAYTNHIDDSIVQVAVPEITCSIELAINAYGDFLPIIPKASKVLKNRLLYRVGLLATFDKMPKALTKNEVSFISDHEEDEISIRSISDRGEIQFCIETRIPGQHLIRCEMESVLSKPLTVDINEAWYESTFLITGYNVCEEADFSGELVMAEGLSEKHKKDFLFSSAGVPMHGSGKTLQGKFIRLKKIGGGWHRNKKGNPDWVDKPNETNFSYAEGVHGAYGDVTEGVSIAIDKSIIPKKSRVAIEGVGERSADDTGSAIKGFHIDVFLGAGNQVVKNWSKGEINGTQRRVKYLGNKE